MHYEQVVINKRNKIKQSETLHVYNAVVTPLRKATSYEQRKTNLGSSP